MTLIKKDGNQTIIKAYVEKANEQEGTLQVCIASTSDMDRDQEIIDQNGWILENFLKNPILLWGHNPFQPPIGKIIDIGIKNGRLLFVPKFDLNDEFAKMIFQKYADGFLNMFSVGFRPLKMVGNMFVQQELLEISAVSVPSNPNAGVMRSLDPVYAMAKSKGYSPFTDSPEEVSKNVIPYRDTGMASKQADWDVKQLEKADVQDLRIVCAWYDKDKADEKSAYLFPHHNIDDKKAVFAGVTAAMESLQKNTDLSEDDRKGVYDHLSKHYEEFSEEAPELKTIAMIEAEKSGNHTLVLLEELRELKKLVKSSILAGSTPIGRSVVTEQHDSQDTGHRPGVRATDIRRNAVILDKAIGHFLKQTKEGVKQES